MARVTTGSNDNKVLSLHSVTLSRAGDGRCSEAGTQTVTAINMTVATLYRSRPATPDHAVRHYSLSQS